MRVMELPTLFSKLNIILICITMLLLTYYYKYAEYPENTTIFDRNVMQPPRFISENHRKLISELQNSITTSNSSSAKDKEVARLLAVLSDVVQTQLLNLQQPTACLGTNIVCGYSGGCGFGCQIHHRIACLIASYALGVPLIHEEQYGWPYRDSWSSAFFQLGSPCEIGADTYRLQWTSPFPPLVKEAGLLVKIVTFIYPPISDTIEFPLKLGIKVSKEIGDLVESIHPNPFMWWVGQFMKFGLRLRPEMKLKINDARKSINFVKPVVGLHIRRTDKVSEIKSRPNEEYMMPAEEYFRNNGETDIKTVFVASEDNTVLNAIREVYSKSQWKVIGFTERKTLATPKSRRDALFEVLTDLFLLADSDFVVCGFSSNLCRLVFEMQHYIHPDSINRLKSVDIQYTYQLLYADIPQNIVKIS